MIKFLFETSKIRLKGYHNTDYELIAYNLDIFSYRSSSLVAARAKFIELAAVKNFLAVLSGCSTDNNN